MKPAFRVASFKIVDRDEGFRLSVIIGSEPIPSLAWWKWGSYPSLGECSSPPPSFCPLTRSSHRSYSLPFLSVLVSRCSSPQFSVAWLRWSSAFFVDTTHLRKFVTSVSSHEISLFIYLLGFTKSRFSILRGMKILSPRSLLVNCFWTTVSSYCFFVYCFFSWLASLYLSFRSSFPFCVIESDNLFECSIWLQKILILNHLITERASKLLYLNLCHLMTIIGVKSCNKWLGKVWLHVVPKNLMANCYCFQMQHISNIFDQHYLAYCYLEMSNKKGKRKEPSLCW